MTDDNTLLLVGGVLLIGAFFAFKDEKKSETGKQETGGDPPTGGEMMDLTTEEATGEKDPKDKGGDKPAPEDVELAEREALNRMENKDSSTQKALKALEEWGIFVSLSHDEYEIWPFSLTTRQELGKHLAKQLAIANEYRYHAERMVAAREVM